MFPLRKRYAFFIVAYVLTLNGLYGEVQNGYESRIEEIKESLNSLNSILARDSGLSLFEKASIRNKINRLVEYIVYYELTRELLDQFKTIAPELYHEIDTITDRAGHGVSVFVTFVPETEMQPGASGTTNVGHIAGNKNVYLSQYGPRSVSVKIAYVKKSMFLLAHEFGHVKYQVPNLASYTDFYARRYQNGTFRSSYIGHHSDDPSGQKAMEYESRFREQYAHYMKASHARLKNPLTLLQGIRKSHGNSEDTQTSGLMAPG